MSSARRPRTAYKEKTMLTSYTFTPHLIMGQVFYGTDRRDPFTFVNPFDPFPMTRWPIVCSVPHLSGLIELTEVGGALFPAEFCIIFSKFLLHTYRFSNWRRVICSEIKTDTEKWPNCVPLHKLGQNWPSLPYGITDARVSSLEFTASSPARSSCRLRTVLAPAGPFPAFCSSDIGNVSALAVST